MEDTFYSTSALAAFALLGLWWVVVAERRRDWLDVADRRRQAYTVSLYFTLPGVMSLASLVSKEQSTVWRLAFGLAGAVGVLETGAALLAARTRPEYRGWFGSLLIATFPFYVAVVAVAISPSLAHDLGIKLKPLETEALLVSVLIFLGVNFAWLLFFEPRPRRSASAD
jgi:MFS family permease